MDGVRPNATATPQTPGSSRSAGRAFSLVELVVVLGVIMILIGLMLPAIASVYSRAVLTRNMSLVRQHAAAIDMYTTDFAGVFPLHERAARSSAIYASRAWYLALLESGHYTTVTEVDPGIARGLDMSYIMSMAMVFDPAKMRPGHTVPLNQQRATPIRSHLVMFPSSKGLVFKANNGIWQPEHGGIAHCCTDLWEYPVGMADGSATSGTYIDFNHGQPVYTENHIGVPVHATWLGTRGRDR